MTPSTYDSTFTASLPEKFNRLNRVIFSADKPEAWQPAIREMNAFLDEVSAWLEHFEEQVGNDIVTSSRILSLLVTAAASGTQGRLEFYQPKDDTGKAYRDQIDFDYLPSSGDMRRKAIAIARHYLTNPAFDTLREAIIFRDFAPAQLAR